MCCDLVTGIHAVFDLLLVGASWKNSNEKYLLLLEIN